MSAYVYASGTYHPLEGNKVVSGGQLVTLKDSDKIVLNGSRYTLGAPDPNVFSGAVITTTETYTDATLEDVTVANGGYVTVSGGVVKNLSVGSGGSAVLIDAGSPDTINIASSGSVVASNSLVHSLSCVPNCEYRQIGGNLANWNGSGRAHIEDCIIQNKSVHGILCILSGGTASSILTGMDGQISVSSGGTAIDTFIDGSFLYNSSYYGRMSVNSGGTAINTNIRHIGSMSVNSGGTAISVTLSQYETYLYINSGGMANSVTVSSGGTLYVSSGGYALNVVNNGGTVSAYQGSVVTYANN